MLISRLLSGLDTSPAMEAGLGIWLVLVVLLALGSAWLARRFLKRLKERLHRLQVQDEDLSRRVDELTRNVERLRQDDRLDHLQDLVQSGEQGGRLSASAAEELRRHIEGLRAP